MLESLALVLNVVSSSWSWFELCGLDLVVGFELCGLGVGREIFSLFTSLPIICQSCCSQQRHCHSQCLRMQTCCFFDSRVFINVNLSLKFVQFLCLSCN